MKKFVLLLILGVLSLLIAGDVIQSIDRKVEAIDRQIEQKKAELNQLYGAKAILLQLKTELSDTTIKELNDD